MTPKTFKINYGNNEDNISEILEIAKQYPNLPFIIKPLQGSGGYGISYIKYNDENEIILNTPSNASKKNSKGNIDINKFYNDHIKYENSGLIVQEYINGTNVSSSILSTKKESKTIVTSNMLTGLDFGIENSFKYFGNIVPFNINNVNNILSLEKEKNIIKHIERSSEDLIPYLKLIGSNGLDMIIGENLEEAYVIEVNPRFQGTYECVEELLGINLLEAHIKACEGELIEIPKITKDKYTIKRIIYSSKRIKLKNNINIANFYDIPYKGVIIEKDEPLLTIITPKDSISNVKNEVNNAVYLIEKELKNDKKS
ncbi:ATP-grasp domain-containing protein [Methanobrevibacter arboriphilus]|uniref:ATP-grasp domain-containing protein n=1 Tax=Methanobrevibacter arboriphilus TaxID=39441 RepID=UPI000A83E89F|nr:ATP-grasp domain-containing protein [Methanobrevibacter arboriphilus]